MSGHFATLLRGTVQVLLPDHDVYITDWHNARDIPVTDGKFGFDDYIDHVIRFLEVMGPGSHVIAVCQPAVAVLAAVAVMAQSDNPAQPRSMTLMAGPIDTRVSPTKVNELAKEHNDRLVREEPDRQRAVPPPGARRRVYPGFLQLTAFVSMNLDRHARAHLDQFKHLVKGDGQSVATHRKFYDEYLAVMDLPAEFFLETVEHVFQDHDLPRGVLTYRDRKVEPAAIRRTALFTVEGELDDICAIGQTMAALDLCTDLQARDEAPPSADRRRPLRRVQRPPLGQRNLSAGPRARAGQSVTLGNRVNCEAASESILRSLSSLLQGGERSEEGLAAGKARGIGGAGQVRTAPASPGPLHPQGWRGRRLARPRRW